jgi:hypothetical protein
MQTNKNFVQCKSKLLKLLDEKIVNVQRKMEGVLYKVGVGSLMYAMVATRYDIAFTVSTAIVPKKRFGLGNSWWM